MRSIKKKIYKSYLKRPVDFIISLVALVVLSPVLLILAILIRTKLGSPILFKQERPGQAEEIFTMYKFRTMTDERDKNGELLPNEMRHTKFGKLLRSTSLDELPELINVLKGDMSLVGPRPLLVDYLSLYNEQQSLRHDVRPGITGYAQVNGRNAISWEEKFERDIYYVKHLNFLLDIKILARTIIKVFKKEDINQGGNVTMQRFKGTKQFNEKS